MQMGKIVPQVTLFDYPNLISNIQNAFYRYQTSATSRGNSSIKRHERAFILLTQVSDDTGIGFAAVPGYPVPSSN